MDYQYSYTEMDALLKDILSGKVKQDKETSSDKPSASLLSRVEKSPRPKARPSGLSSLLEYSLGFREDATKAKQELSVLAPETSPRPKSRNSDIAFTNSKDVSGVTLNSEDVNLGEIAIGLREAAETLGIDPVDLATVVSYETAGTFNPTKAGPTTKWGQHRGLIQFGEPQANEFGVNWEDPYNSQLGSSGAIVKYLKQRGVVPGMSLLDLYSTINAGSPGLYEASDEAAGGAKGTVREKVAGMADHRKKALLLMQGSQPKTNPFIPRKGK